MYLAYLLGTTVYSTIRRWQHMPEYRGYVLYSIALGTFPVVEHSRVSPPCFPSTHYLRHVIVYSTVYRVLYLVLYYIVPCRPTGTWVLYIVLVVVEPYSVAGTVNHEHCGGPCY